MTLYCASDSPEFLKSFEQILHLIDGVDAVVAEIISDVSMAVIDGGTRPDLPSQLSELARDCSGIPVILCLPASEKYLAVFEAVTSLDLDLKIFVMPADGLIAAIMREHVANLSGVLSRHAPLMPRLHHAMRQTQSEEDDALVFDAVAQFQEVLTSYVEKKQKIERAGKATIKDDAPSKLWIGETLDPLPSRRHMDGSYAGHALDDLAQTWSGHLGGGCVSVRGRTNAAHGTTCSWCDDRHIMAC